jgi:hypothetical protein
MQQAASIIVGFLTKNIFESLQGIFVLAQVAILLGNIMQSSGNIRMFRGLVDLFS